jgi:hypothetical protein
MRDEGRGPVKAPPRLAEGDDLRARLLRSAREDAPTARSRKRATAAVALAVGALATRSTAALAAGTVARSLLLKVLLGAGVATVVATASLDSPRTAQAPADPTTIVRPAQRGGPKASATLPRAIPPPSSAESPVTPPAVVAAPTAAAAGSTRAKTMPARRASNSLADEVAVLAEAKRAIEAGQTAAAFRAIAEHDRRFPGGVLSEEAAALRVEAAARSGDKAGAASLSRAFEAAYPESPLRDQVRALRE